MAVKQPNLNLTSTDPKSFYPSDGEQQLIADLTEEMVDLYGHRVVYIRRTARSYNVDEILGEDYGSYFKEFIELNAYFEPIDSFDGGGVLWGKLNITIEDQLTIFVPRNQWKSRNIWEPSSVATSEDDQQRIDAGYGADIVDEELNNRIHPLEGDLVYLPLSKSLFQILYVEKDLPFYQLNKLFTYQMRMEVYTAQADEEVDTAVDAIDDLAEKVKDAETDNSKVEVEGDSYQEDNDEDDLFSGL